MTPSFLSAGEAPSQAIQDMHHYWTAVRGARELPRKADIWPGDIKPLLPNVLLVDIERAPFRVRFRLVGTKVVAATGFDFTGCYLDEIAPPHDIDTFLACYRLAVFGRRPVIARVQWHFKTGERAAYDLGVWPLSDDGTAVDKAIALECYANLENCRNFFHGRPRRWHL